MGRETCCVEGTKWQVAGTVVSTVPVGINFAVVAVSKMPMECNMCWQAVAAVVTGVLHFVEIMVATIIGRVVAAIIVWDLGQGGNSGLLHW